MPEVVGPATAAIAGALGVGGNTFAVALINAAVTASVVTAQSFALSAILGTQRPAIDDYRRDVPSTGGVKNHDFIISEALTAGHKVYANTFGAAGDDYRNANPRDDDYRLWLEQVFMMAGHELNDVTGWDVNGETVTWNPANFQVTSDPYTSRGFQYLFLNYGLGTDGQNADPLLTGAPRGGWRATDRLQGLAYFSEMRKAKGRVWPNGPVPIRAYVEGAKTYDPTQDDTVPGGAGPHRADDPSTWDYDPTKNWARNFLWWHRSYWGPLWRLAERSATGYAPSSLYNLENWAAAVQKCSELVDDGKGGTEPRYQMQGVPARGREYDFVNTQGEMLTACAGRLAFQRGQFYVFPAAYYAAEGVIDWHTEPISTSLQYRRGPTLEEKVTRIVGSLVSQQDSFATVDYTAVNDPDATGGVITRQVNQPWSPSFGQAFRVGRILQRRANANTIRATMGLGAQILAADVAETKSITDPRMSLEDAAMVITRHIISSDEAGFISGEIDLIEERASFYADDEPVPLPPGAQAPLSVTNNLNFLPGAPLGAATFRDLQVN